MPERMPTDYRTIKDMEYLDASDLEVIQVKAKALTLQECFDFLCIIEAEVPSRELGYAKLAWKRGRVTALSNAADNLFSQMQMRGGGPIAFEYLKQLSSTFQLEVAPSGTGSGNPGFAFNVIMPDESQKSLESSTEQKVGSTVTNAPEATH